MNKQAFKQRIQAATGQILCDLVIKNITIVDVFQNNTFVSSVGVKNGYIVGIGEFDAHEIIDGTDKYLCPGLIDAHAHIESSLVTPLEYYKSALRHGITSMIVDPHEIANVLGTKGIELMLQLSENIPFDFYFMLPSCVPATNFENSGAILESHDLAPFYNHPRVLGLAEVMNYPAVIQTEDDMIQKLIDAASHRKVIDGHCAGFTNDLINAYRSAHILTDHECHSPLEVIERIRRGMYVLMREGTVAKNLKDLITATTISNSRRVCLCTDDKHIDDLIENGSIDQSIKEIISYGLSPETAIQMATLNTAECYNLKHKGAIAPGYLADFLILDDLQTFKIQSVYKNGTLVVKNNELLLPPTESASNHELENSIHLPKLQVSNFKIDISGKTILNVMKLIPNKLESLHLTYELTGDEGDEFISCTQKDLLKIAVIERHKATGNIGLGVLQGLELQGGAIATTIAHDSQNIIVCGANDEDMLFAVETLKTIQGGIVIVRDQQVLASIPLEIGGLITARPTEEVLKDLDHLHHTIALLAPTINFNPFLTLSFLALPVIPELKITDKGLFNVTKFEFINVAE